MMDKKRDNETVLGGGSSMCMTKEWIRFESGQVHTTTTTWEASPSARKASRFH